MTKTKIVAAASVLLAMAGVVSAESMRDWIIDKYGLNRLTPQNRDDVAMWIEYGSEASQAINNSGLQVLRLDRITRGNVSEKYIWIDSKGFEYVTEHFIGAGAFGMLEGQTYLGDISPLWVIVQKNGNEVKFTIE